MIGVNEDVHRVADVIPYAARWQFDRHHFATIRLQVVRCPVSIEPITRQNALAFKAARLRALQDTPTAFSSTYADESRDSDEDWLQRADRWSGDRSTSFLALDSDTPCGIVGAFLAQLEHISA